MDRRMTVAVISCCFYLSTVIVDCFVAILYLVDGLVLYPVLTLLWVASAMLVCCLFTHRRERVGEVDGGDRGSPDQLIRGTDASNGGVKKRCLGGLLHWYLYLFSRSPSDTLSRSVLLCHLYQVTCQSAPQVVLQVHLCYNQGEVTPLNGLCITIALMNILWITLRQNCFETLLPSASEVPNPMKPTSSLSLPQSGENRKVLHRTSSLPSVSSKGIYSSLHLPQTSTLPLYHTQKKDAIRSHKFGSVITLKERCLISSNGQIDSQTQSSGSLSYRQPRLNVVRAMASVLLLLARLASLIALSVLVGPWIFMSICIHVTLMFLLAVTEVTSGDWSDVTHCLSVATIYAFTYFRILIPRLTWRQVVFQVFVSVQNLAAVVTLLFTEQSVLTVAMELAIVIPMTLGCFLLLVDIIIERRNMRDETVRMENIKASTHFHVPIAETEDLSDGTEDSSSCTSDEGQRDGLLFSVQDLLANMSYIEENNLQTSFNQQQNGGRTIQDGGDIQQNGSLAHSAQQNGRSNNTETVVDVRDVVIDVSKSIKSANIMQCDSFKRDYNEYSMCEFKSKRDYENYPQRIEDIDVDSGKGSTTNTPQDSNSPSPTYFERSVTRGCAEEAEIEVAGNISALEVSHEHPQETKRMENLNDIFEPRDNLYSECNDILYPDPSLMRGTSGDCNTVGLPDVSPSSLYTSQNSSLAVDTVISYDNSGCSYHRPASSNVEMNVIKKVPSLTTTPPKPSHDYENVYDDNTPKMKSNNSPPLPLPPRKYIVKYPYIYFPRAFIPQYTDKNNSSTNSNHDYENIPASCVHRALLGVRHWKPYMDIQNRDHDFSTYKEKSKINSTTFSSVDQTKTIKGLSAHEESVISRSLPDLSNLVIETCVEEPEELESRTSNIPENTRLLDLINSLRTSSKPLRSNSVTDLTNYESIWVDKSNNPIRFEDRAQVLEKDSMCNLYYSRISDLSRRYFNNADDNNSPSIISALLAESKIPGGVYAVPTKRKLGQLEEIAEVLEENLNETDEVKNLKKSEIKTPSKGTEQKKRKMWTPLKSPLKFTSPKKALQVGMKVFNRPRIHTITNDDGKELNSCKKIITSPFRSKSKEPNAPTINIRNTENIEIKMKQTDSRGNEMIFIKRTPFKEPLPVTKRLNVPSNPPASQPVQTTSNIPKPAAILPIQNTPIESKSSTIRPVQKTPKTSTPDSQRAKKMSSKPSHSTPEGADKHLPQMSILSGLSSVVESPELSRISSNYAPLLPRRYWNGANPCQQKLAFTEDSEERRPPRQLILEPLLEDDLDLSKMRMLAVNKNIYQSMRAKHSAANGPQFAYPQSTLTPNSKIFSHKV